eukprot:CAMPEP_0183754946 /NCGR_PEP_ID=MMETSP0739-20130205/3803_1 /TAXON_ID=385413 /ORGANISM="Thalassiosira miniscula, Strain CCMP1093" /LENGTH=608 /DNA_ID=CAMNT_0025991601 /DNA_START=6 /DNA_END=1829 /DNA_ORIENTATION=+
MATEDDPFELIQKGNAFEAASDHWRSSEYYGRASSRLRSRADDLSSQIRSDGNPADAAAASEKRKVVSLFRAQSLEYLYKARHCLLEALRFENEQDRTRTREVAQTGTGSLDPLCSMIDAEECERRRLVFERVFSAEGLQGLVESKTEEAKDGVAEDDAMKKSPSEAKQNDKQIIDESAFEEEEGNATLESPPAAPAAQINDNANNMSPQNPTASNNNNVPSSTSQSNAAGVDDRRQSIESRLAQLDTSLLPNVPPPFISGSRTAAGGGGGGNNDDQSRIDEIRRGLGRLGVSLPDNNTGSRGDKKSLLLPPNISAEDQVKLIIQQAQDEVRVEKGLHVVGGEGNESKNNTNGLIDATNIFNQDSFDDDIIDENDSMFEGYEDDDYDIDALLSKAETLVARTSSGMGLNGGDGEGGGGEGGIKCSSEIVQIKKVQALLLEARLCLEMERMPPKSSEEDTELSNNEPEGREDGSSSETLEKDLQPLSLEDRDALLEDINLLPESALPGAMQIVQGANIVNDEDDDHGKDDDHDDEHELDLKIEKLDAKTQRKLQSYVKTSLGTEATTDDSAQKSKHPINNDGVALAARKKARELIEQAGDCMKALLKDW